MNCLKNISAALLASLLCFALGACGGDDNDVSGPTEAAVTFTLVSLDPAVGAVNVVLDLPNGFILATEPDTTLSTGVVTLAPTLPGVSNLIAANYIPEALPAPGQLRVALASTVDFAPAAIFTVAKALAPGEPLPASADFVIVSLLVDGVDVTKIPGNTLTIEVQRRTATL